MALSTALNVSSTLSSSSRVSSFGVWMTPMRTSMEAIPSRSGAPALAPAMLAIALRAHLARTVDAVEVPVVAGRDPLLCVHPLVHDDPDAEEAEQLTRNPEQSRPGPLVGERACSPRALDLVVPARGDHRPRREQRDAHEGVERQEHQHVEQPGAVAERVRYRVE